MAFHPQPAIRGFKTTLTIIGVVYILLASSMLVRGPEALLDFGVSDALVRDPVLVDFFLFFYQLMALVGVLTVVFGHVARERGTQVLVAATFCVANILIMLRDLSTSDSALGNRLYEGEKTLVFVFISLALALVFGSFVVRGLRQR